MQSAIALGALVASAYAASGEYEYSKSGEDWGKVVDICAFGTEQSPINLTSSDAETSSKTQVNGYGYKNYGKTADRQSDAL